MVTPNRPESNSAVAGEADATEGQYFFRDLAFVRNRS